MTIWRRKLQKSLPSVIQWFTTLHNKVCKSFLRRCYVCEVVSLLRCYVEILFSLILLHCYVVTLSRRYVYIVTLLHCYVFTLLHCYVFRCYAVTWLFCYVVTLLRSYVYVVTSSRCYAVALPLLRLRLNVDMFLLFCVLKFLRFYVVTL